MAHFTRSRMSNEKTKGNIKKIAGKKILETHSASPPLLNTPGKQNSTPIQVSPTMDIPNKAPSWFVKFDETLDALNTKLTGIDNRLICAQTTADNALEEANSAKLKIDNLQKENDEIKCQLQTLEKKILSNDIQFRKNNLIFDGIPETGKETENWSDTEKIIMEVFENKLQIPNSQSIHLEKAYRMGQRQKGKTRPILARFSNCKDRDTVWSKRGNLKNFKTIWMSEDFPQEINEKRKVFYPIIRAAQRKKDKTVSLKLDKLVIKGKAYTVDMMESLPEEYKLRNLATRNDREKKVTVFYSRNSLFSNFSTESPITMNENQYNCVEQYYQHTKALEFEDMETANAIMNSTDPLQQMTLGKKIKGYDNTKWEKNNKDYEVLLAGNKAKFEQNFPAREALLETGDNMIGEASPHPRWGIGLGINNSKVMDTTSWGGENLMGKILVKIRKDF